MSLTTTLSSNQRFRDELGEFEALVYDSVKKYPEMSRGDLADKLGTTVMYLEMMYDRAFEKFLKYATRTEM